VCQFPCVRAWSCYTGSSHFLSYFLIHHPLLDAKALHVPEKRPVMVQWFVPYVVSRNPSLLNKSGCACIRRTQFCLLAWSLATLSTVMHNTSSAVFVYILLYLFPLLLFYAPPHKHSIDSDTLIFIDFRADRMRQIVEALGIKPQFQTDAIPRDLVHNLSFLNSHVFSFF
jgi:hypothetical protein